MRTLCHWHKSDKFTNSLWRWLAWRLPSPLVYWATIRLMSRVTSGEYDNTVVPDLTAVEALRRWEAAR